MIKKFVFVFALFVLMISLTGCTLPLPTCPTDSLQEVTLTSPAQVSVVDTLTPTLQWTYPSTECAPAGYAITMWEGPVMTTNIGGGTGNPSTSWGPGAPLQPGKQYRWNVAPINGTTLGPVSNTFIFFTGPVCTDASLIAPSMIEPADGAAFNESTDLLWWDFTGGCTPTGYQVDVATDSSFASGLYPSGIVDIPLTRVMLGDPPLVECETYYWRVAARNGATVGPFSPTRSFVADKTGLCGGGGGIPPASASIGGIVWHDQCITPAGPAPDPLSVGCVDAGSGVIRANGIREPGEPGIAGVQVDLHFGGCATTSVASVITDSNGQYLFDGILAFGSYCVAIRPLNPPNDSILIPGEWTYPPSISGADAFANAMVDTGTVLANVDFGWDYQFLPVAGEPSPVPTAVSAANSGAPQFEFTKNAFCRKGPGLNFSDLTAIPSGDIVEVRGVSADTQWYFVFWSKFKAECWVATSTGKLIGDAFNIPVLASPPTPVPSAVPSTNNNNPTPVPTLTPVKP